METAIIVVWTIGLSVALAATLVILKEVSLIIGALQDILLLSKRTRDAARGLARNVESVDRLSDLAAPGAHLHRATAELALRSIAMSQKLTALAAWKK
jgi:hypothetical protein